MRYKLLGRSGLRVSELCLGTMTFGEDWGWGASKDECQKMFDAFVEAGGNFIDTACNYTNGSAEKITGELVASARDRFVVATKYTLSMRPNDPNGGGNHRKNLMQSVNASLKRLNTDYIDVLYVHAWDFTTQVDELMRGLDDIVRSGKVNYVGISDTPAWQVARCNTLADLRGFSPFVVLQTQYSLIERTSERDLLPMAQALDLAVTGWGALGSGVLTGKYNAQPEAGARLAEGDWGRAMKTERNLKIASEVANVAKAIDRSPSQVAIAWTRRAREGGGPVMLPIVGARKLSQLKDNLGALEVTLAPEHLAKLEQASSIDLGFPHAFLQQARGYIFGETFPLIDNHRAGR